MWLPLCLKQAAWKGESLALSDPQCGVWKQRGLYSGSLKVPSEAAPGDSKTLSPAAPAWSPALHTSVLG